MPGIDTVEPTDNTVGGWVEFWPYNYGNAKSDLAGAPANTSGYDWSDPCSYSGDFACMQVHRSLTGARNPAQVLFVFNRWRATGAHQIGLGNYACQTKGSMDSMQLKEVERAKIGCAEKLFNNLSTSNVRYHKVDSYQTLLDIMKSID